MLQITTGIYFRSCVALNSHRHRQVYYTNRSFLTFDDIDLPVGRVLPTTTVSGVSAVMIEAVEHREALTEDGSEDFVLASGGTELLDDVADVLSFAMNSIFSRDHDLVHRLVAASTDTSGQPLRGRAADQLRDTLQPNQYASADTIEDAREFMRKLIALRRSEYETAMRAIRRVIGAWQKIDERPTAAYTDLVAALESLADKAQNVPAPTWENVDPRKRKVLDPVLADLDEQKRADIQDAVIESERAGARLRFTEFVMAHVSSSFYREAAVGAQFPVRGPDLRRALNTAYAIRSNDVHALLDLPVEAWSWAGSAETVDVPSLGRILTIEGLSRLARHVVRAFLDEAPTAVDYGFDWRGAVPGQINVTLAPQYWLWQAPGLNTKSAPTYFDGLLSYLIDLAVKGENEIADMTAVLERVEKIVPTLAPGTPGRRELVGIYALWHGHVAPDLRRPDADPLLAAWDADLTTPSAEAFAVGLLNGTAPAWAAQQYLDLTKARREERGRKKPRPLPQGVDAALLFIAAEKCATEGMTEEAAQLAAWTLEEVPGDSALLTWEGSLSATGFTQEVDLRAVVFSRFDDDGDTDTADTSPAGGDTETGAQAENQAGTDGNEVSGQLDATTPTVQFDTDTVPVASDVVDNFVDDAAADGAAQIKKSPAVSAGEVSASPTLGAPDADADARS